MSQPIIGYKIFLAAGLLAFAISLNSYAKGGGIDLGGGDAVVSRNSVRLLDRAEKESFAMEAQPAYVDDLLPRLKIIERDDFHYHVKYNLYSKENYLYLHNLIGAAMGRLQWYFVNGPLPELNDEGVDVFYLPYRGKKVQLAMQVKNTVFVRRNLFTRLPERDQAGLFLHELVLNHVLHTHPAALGRKVSGEYEGTSKIRTFTNLVLSDDFKFIPLRRIQLAFRAIGVFDIQEVNQVDDDIDRRFPGFSQTVFEAAVKTNEEFERRGKALTPGLTKSQLCAITPGCEEGPAIKGRASSVRAELVAALGRSLQNPDVTQDAESKLIKFIELVIKRPDMITDDDLSQFQWQTKIIAVRFATAYNNENAVQKLLSGKPSSDEVKMWAAIASLKGIARRRAQEQKDWQRAEEHFTRVFTQPMT